MATKKFRLRSVITLTENKNGNMDIDQHYEPALSKINNPELHLVVQATKDVCAHVLSRYERGKIIIT